MRNMRGYGAVYSLALLWNTGERGLFVFELCRRLFFNAFPFPQGTDRLLGDFYVNRQGTTNMFILIIMRQYNCAPMSPAPLY